MSLIGRTRRVVLAIAAATVTTMSVSASATMCGTMNYPFPFTDVAGVSDTFCLGILEAFVVGITTGTTTTTFGPNDNVSRLQMTTFLQRTFDQGLKRSSRRAALEQWWIPRDAASIQSISVGFGPRKCAGDGEHIWVATAGEVVQVQASTGKLLGTWTGAIGGSGLVVAASKVFLVQRTNPGMLLFVDPTQPPGPLSVAAANLGSDPINVAFDGTRLWSANFNGGSPGGSVSIVTLQAVTPYPVTTVTAGFVVPRGVFYDGTSIWVTDQGDGTLKRLDATGAIVQSVSVGANPGLPVFDGTNIWVPGSSGVTVVQAGNGAVLTTIFPDGTNLLSNSSAAAFDGERVLVTNQGNNSVTLFKAADLSVIANVAAVVLSQFGGACSDGVNFWATDALGRLLRL